MHLHPEHSEKHFIACDTVRDVLVGMSDGPTVPFALAPASPVRSPSVTRWSRLASSRLRPAPSSWALAATWLAEANPSHPRRNARRRRGERLTSTTP